MDLFDFNNKQFIIDKPVRMITLFSGYDSQCLAMKYLGVPFEHYKTEIIPEHKLKAKAGPYQFPAQKLFYRYKFLYIQTCRVLHCNIWHSQENFLQ